MSCNSANVECNNLRYCCVSTEQLSENRTRFADTIPLTEPVSSDSCFPTEHCPKDCTKVADTTPLTEKLLETRYLPRAQMSPLDTLCLLKQRQKGSSSMFDAVALLRFRAPTAVAEVEPTGASAKEEEKKSAFSLPHISTRSGHRKDSLHVRTSLLTLNHLTAARASLPSFPLGKG